MEKQSKLFNPIGFLNELCQKTKTAFPVYNIIKRDGPAHSPSFHIECVFKDQYFSGTGLSVKDAKEDAANKAIEELKLKDTPKENKSSFKIVECDNIECVWNGTSSEIKIKFRKKDEYMQQFKTFLFSKIEEIEEIDDEIDE